MIIQRCRQLGRYVVLLTSQADGSVYYFLVVKHIRKDREEDEFRKNRSGFEKLSR